MHIKDYISSGIIESYVLGLTSPEESAEFEKLCIEYPELVNARDAFEIALEKQMTSDALSPAPAIRENVMRSIRQLNSGNQTKIITMDNNARTTRSSSPLGWVAAVAIILVLAAGYFAYDFYTKNKSLKTELAESKKSKEDMDSKLKQLEMVNDPNVAVVNLKGMEKAPKSSASVYWDSTSSNVFLVVKNMPKLANDKQYQLWSIINGQKGLEPTSLGLFDVGDDGKIILKMGTGTKKADAFAITIEKRGNSGGPNLEELQAMGKPQL